MSTSLRDLIRECRSLAEFEYPQDNEEGLGSDAEDFTHKASMAATKGITKVGHAISKVPVIGVVGHGISHVGNFMNAGMRAGRGIVLKRRGDAAGAQKQFNKASEAGKESLKDVGRGAASLFMKKT